MAFLNKSTIKRYAQNYQGRSHKTARSIVMESERSHASWKSYDVFLSHSVKDAEIVLGVKAWLEEKGNSVYVDWVEDAELDRTKVTPENANILRERMQACASLIFIATDNASDSKWVPWELGYFDGLKGNRVAILPVLDDWKTSSDGQEYLGLYPVIDIPTAGYNAYTPVVRRKNSSSASLHSFTKGHPIYA
jgi:hypothetical protein